LSRISNGCMQPGFFRRRIIPFIGALIIFIVSFAVLYLGDNVGLSDNGDFRRVLLTNNIEYVDQTDHYYLFKQDYVMKLENTDNVFAAMHEAWQTNKEEAIYSSPHFLIIKLSKELNIIANAAAGRELTNYNIAYMAFIYIFMLSVAAWSIFTFFSDTKIKVQASVFVLFILIFCDAGYLLYFNSFYGEGLQYTALLMLAAFGILIYKRPSIPKVIGFFVSLYFFAGSKLANIPYSLLVAALAVVMAMMRCDRRFRTGVVISALICIVSITSLYTSIPEWMDRDTTYQAVFLGITKDSENPEKDLAELGVDPKYAALCGTHAYMDEDEYPIDINSDEFERDFYDKVSKSDIAMFYVHHPLRLIHELCLAVENSAYIRPPIAGNSQTIPMELTEKFSLWSKLRVSMRFLYTPWVIFIAFAVITLYMLFMNIFYVHNHKIESPQRKYMIFSLDILILGLWINLLLPIMCNGEADIAKHMFLFTTCIDILFFICIVRIVTLPLKQFAAAAAAMTLFTGLFYIDIPKKTLIFGSFNGKPIKWEIIDTYADGSMTIISEKSIGIMPFDTSNNRWETSELRRWLNSDFLNEFSAADRERILTTENSVLLPYSARYEATEGNHAHYWNFTRSLVGDMSESAYRHNITDTVYIPTLDMIENDVLPGSYWIMCPYTGNDTMMRFMNKDGFILHTDVRTEKGVRAVMRIKK
jgi:hypothetical protein